MAKNKLKEPSKELTTIRIDPTKLDKLRYMAWFDRKTVTYFVDSGITDQIVKWENKNGSITKEQILESQKD